MVTADVTPCGRARMPLGEQSGRCGGHGAAARVCGGVRWRLDELHCGGQVHPPAGWTTCGWALARVRAQYATTRCGSAAR